MKKEIENVMLLFAKMLREPEQPHMELIIPREDLKIIYLIMFKKILNKLKSLTKKQPELNEEDEFIIKAFYKKVEKIISYKVWRKVVLKYSADTMSDIYDSCDILVDIIYKKYSK